ncbi:MAG: hypothetical protein U1C96_00335 [Gallionella sp.]|nr:hypothetical protein [Gallionella sp.]
MLIRAQFVGIFFALISSVVFAADEPTAEQQRRAEKAISDATARVNAAQGAVAQVMDEAIYGQYGELHKWSVIDQKMDELDKAISDAKGVISQQGHNMPSDDPGRLITSFKIGYIFEGNIERASTKKKQLLELLKSENQKLDKLNNLIAKTEAARRKAAMGLVGDTIEGMLPSEAQLAGEGAVIVLGAYFGPPGIAIAGLAVGASFTFNSLANLYYGTKSLAEQAKVLTDMEQTLAKNKQIVEQNLKKLNDAAKEMTEVETVLKRNQVRMDGFRKQIEGAIEEWAKASPKLTKQLDKAAAAYQAAPKNTGSVTYTPLSRSDRDLLLQAHSQIDSAERDKLMQQAERAAQNDHNAYNRAATARNEALEGIRKSLAEQYAKNLINTATYDARYKKEYQEPHAALGKLASLDWAKYSAETQLIIANARPFAIQKMDKLQRELLPVLEQVTAAESAARGKLGQLAEGLSKRGEFSGLLNHASFLENQIKSYPVLTSDEPGHLTRTLFRPLEDASPVINGAIKQLEGLRAKEKEIYKAYSTGIQVARNRYESVVPENLRSGQYEPSQATGNWTVQAASGSWGSIPYMGVSIGYNLPASEIEAIKKDNETLLAEIARYAGSESLNALARADFAASETIALIIPALQIFAPYIGLNMEEEKTYAEKQFKMKDGLVSTTVSASQSDAAVYLRDMQNAWGEGQAMVNKMVNHGKTRGSVKTLLKYHRNDPAPYGPYIDAMGMIPEKIKLYQDMLDNYNKGGDTLAERSIREMYQKFKQAYESRNVTALMRFMSSDWETEDGTSRDDLEQNLRNSFRLFDGIQFGVEGLSIRKSGEDYEVSYSSTLSGQMRQMKKKHEEKASVKDIVRITNDGPLITKTSGGNLWLK